MSFLDRRHPPTHETRETYAVNCNPEYATHFLDTFPLTQRSEKITLGRKYFLRGGVEITLRDGGPAAVVSHLYDRTPDYVRLIMAHFGSVMGGSLRDIDLNEVRPLTSSKRALTELVKAHARDISAD